MTRVKWSDANCSDRHSSHIRGNDARLRQKHRNRDLKRCLVLMGQPPPQKKQNGVKDEGLVVMGWLSLSPRANVNNLNLASVPICYLLWFCLFGKVHWQGARTWASQLFLLMHKATTTASLVVNSVIVTVDYLVCEIEMRNQFRKVLLCILREWTVEFSLVCLNFWRGASSRQSTVYRANIKSLSKSMGKSRDFGFTS